ncbi:MAG: DUF554 family protein, partial [Pedosphaera parvula]|nr:DUF554 family protein [Pedosphaera parvula]
MAESRHSDHELRTRIQVIMAGTIINALGALLGGILGLVLKRQPDTAVQTAIKSLIGLLLIWVGLAMTWVNLGGGVWNVCKQMIIVVLALTFGRITGRLLHLQKSMNRLGQYARAQFAKVEPG